MRFQQVLRPLSAVVVGLALLGGVLFVYESWQVAVSQTAPDRHWVGNPPADFPHAIGPVSFTTADGVLLKGWYAPSADTRQAIILLHPYQADRRAMLARARLFREAGYGVLLYDARASGESGGLMRSFGYHEAADVVAAVKFLREQGVEQIALLGWSQGGSTLLMAAGQLGNVKAVILESAFDTLEHATDRAFRRRIGLPGWLAGVFYTPFLEHRLAIREDDFRPIDHIARLSCPVYVISGSEDSSTWASDTEALFAAAREPKRLWLLAGADHQDLYAFAPAEYRRRVLMFLAQAMPLPAGPPAPARLP